MTRKAISIYMAATCAIAVVCPGRFVCGIVIAVELCMLMLFGLLFRALLTKIKVDNIMQSAMLLFIVFSTILIKNILAILMPELALQMSFVLYLPSISTFTTVFLLEDEIPDFKNYIKKDMALAIMFACYMLIVTFIRDILGYGTLTLPAFGRQFELVIFNPEKISALTFLATIPGSLILNAVILSGYIFIEKKFNILKRAGIK